MLRNRMSRAGALAACAVLGLTGLTGPSSARALPSGPAVPGGGGRAHAGAVPGAAPATPRAATTNAASYPVNGIDVASYQHSNGAAIDWTAVAGSGVEFAYVKATEGTTYVNPYYQSDAQAAKQAGLYVGAYAYVRPDSNDAVAQADKLLTVAPVASDGRTLPPMIDIEWPYSGSGVSDACWGLTPTQMSTWLRSFVDRVHARIGRAPTIYTNNFWWDPCTGNNTTFGSSPLSIAHYNGSPTPLPLGWANWTFWQHTDAATVPGIVGGVDADVFNGSLADVGRLTGSPLVNGKYLSYAYAAASRKGSAVYINGLVKQGSATGTVRSPKRTVYLQRNLHGAWQTMLLRVTDWYGVFTVGFISVPNYQYRFVVTASGNAWGTTSGGVATTTRT